MEHHTQGLGGRVGFPGRPRSPWAALQAASPPPHTSDNLGVASIDALARGVPDSTKLVLWVRASLNEHALSGRIRRLCEQQALVLAHYHRCAALELPTKG